MKGGEEGVLTFVHTIGGKFLVVSLSSLVLL